MCPGKTTFLGCLKRKYTITSVTRAAGGIMSTNIIITAELIAAEAHPGIITAFHLTWPGTLLKMYFYLKSLLCQREDIWRKKMESIWRKILELKSSWSLTVMSQSCSAWGVLWAQGVQRPLLLSAEEPGPHECKASHHLPSAEESQCPDSGYVILDFVWRGISLLSGTQ